jgi:integrase
VLMWLIWLCGGRSEVEIGIHTQKGGTPSPLSTLCMHEIDKRLESCSKLSSLKRQQDLSVRYLEQEPQQAGNNEPLFVHTRSGIDQRMTGSNLSSIYRDAARRMGITWEKGEHNPLRPKRMRRLFRIACDAAGITEVFTNAFMGHKNSQGQDYSQSTRPMLELEYVRVEPFLTVSGEVEEEDHTGIT